MVSSQAAFLTRIEASRSPRVTKSADNSPSASSSIHSASRQASVDKKYRFVQLFIENQPDRDYYNICRGNLYLHNKFINIKKRLDLWMYYGEKLAEEGIEYIINWKERNGDSESKEFLLCSN